MMLRVGLTGGIASGKSLVAKKLLDLGAYVIDADTISRVVMRPETACWKKIIAAFGKGIPIKNPKGAMRTAVHMIR